MEQPKRKKKRSANSAKSQDDTGQSCENLLNSNAYITYDILRLVFKYLNGRDLSNAAMVCSSWLEAANKEHYIRGLLYFITNNSSRTFKHQIRNLCIKPRIGILFMHEFMKAGISDIKNVLPSNCEIIVLDAPGIIINNEEIEDSSCSKIVCTFLPKISNVSINTCQVTKLSNVKRCTEDLKQIMNHIFESNHEMSMCLMLFCNNLGRKIVHTIGSALTKSWNNKICSLWGGVVENINCMQNSQWKKPCCVAVLISGAIQTWSTIIDQICNTQELIEKKLKSFKDRIKLKQHSIGFMFVCIARGSSMHEEKDVESTIFKTLFPNVPLIGCFGFGEFGKNTMDIDDTKEKTPMNKLLYEQNSSSNKQRKYSDHKSSWYNEFSTVFMILTYD